ncbi:MAG: protein kinase [Isosphaeraceae bacterium]
MPLTCPRCSKIIEFSGERPRFCPYCGAILEPTAQALPLVDLAETAPYERHATETIAYLPEANRLKPADTWPDQVANYRLIRLLGQGGMGAVFEAEELGTGRLVALKLIAQERVRSAESLERFRQEGRLASTVSHPRCVFVLAADEENGRPYIVMELMPGTTLQDLVERHGPMKVEQAVPRILDVIDGLKEAHRLGVIHRDVKPSNCFIDAHDRTKIGDFGLSKSLGGTSNLTRTGAFLGTPLYASPEQIKGEMIDERTDVYSAAASLYYLIAGRPPFQGTDAAATLARIVSEPLEPLRNLRPDVPPELERALLRGMERDRNRRFRDLEEFRAAILPFAPGRMSGAWWGRRIAAYLLDVGASNLALIVLLNLVLELVTRGRYRPSPVVDMRASMVVELLTYLFAYGLLEAYTGASPGKWLFSLRVWGTGLGNPTVGSVWRRTALFFLVAALPWQFWELSTGVLHARPMPEIMWALRFFAPFLLFLPSLRDGSTRGWHERWTGTRVVSLPRSARRRAPHRRRPVGKEHGGVARPAGVMSTIGPYEIRGAVRWEDRRKVLSAEDPMLGRESWVVLRPKGSPPPSEARRDLVRETRTRWLAGGEQGDNRWDAFLAPTGCPLTDLAGADGLSWADTRPLLEDLTQELVAATADGTLPGALDPDMVWVQPDGVAILVDGLEPSRRSPSDGRPAPDRALDLLRESAAVALEGGRRRSGDRNGTIAAPVPLHAREILDRLGNRPDAFRDPAAVRDALEATLDGITEVDRTRRALHLAAQMILMLPGLAAMFGLTLILLREFGDAAANPSAEVDDWLTSGPQWQIMVAACVILAWVGWSAITRGGLSLRLLDMGLVRRDGQPAGRIRCALRSLLAWIVPGSLLIASGAAMQRAPDHPWIAWLAFGLANVAILSYIPLSLYRPDRGPHDRLAGTVIVPR